MRKPNGMPTATVPGTQGMARGVGRMSDTDWPPRVKCSVQAAKSVGIRNAVSGWATARCPCFSLVLCHLFFLNSP